MGTVAKYLAQVKLLAAIISLISINNLTFIYLLFNKMNSLSIFILVVVIAQFTIAEEKPENTTVTSPTEDATQHEVIENKNSQSDEFMAKEQENQTDSENKSESTKDTACKVIIAGGFGLIALSVGAIIVLSI